MSDREVVLGRIRDALGGTRPARPPARDYRRAGTRAPTQVVDLFVERVDDYRATVTRSSAAALPDTIAARLAAAGAATLVVPPGMDPDWLAALAAEVEVRRDHPPLAVDVLDRTDVVLTAAAIGIADTGTIVLDGAPDQGRRAITLVPDHHLCVIRARQLVETVPEAFARLTPTRPLTFISGPSATSDIELDRVEGVHGPRILDVIVVTDAADEQAVDEAADRTGGMTH